MHEHGADALGHRNLLHARMVDAHGEHEAAEQAGRDVVDVQRAARHLLALHRELQQLELRAAACRAAHWPRPPRPPPTRPSRRARSRAECPCRCPCRNRNPGFSASCIASSARPAVFFSGSRGRSFTTPAEPLMTTPGLRRALDGDPIAERIHREAEDVEADGDVAAEAGANAVAWSASRSQARSEIRATGAAGRRTRRPP